MESESDLELISNGVYRMVDEIIGHETVIKVRRTIGDLRDRFEFVMSYLGNLPIININSGSKAEGFRFSSSDDDWLVLYRNIRVIPDMTYANMYGHGTTILLMDNEINKPGFTFLRLNSKSYNHIIQITATYDSVLNGQFISSKKWREKLAEWGILYGAYIHGPCTSAKHGVREYELANCLKSDIWPNMAAKCIRRLQQCGWPSPDVISKIVNDGILFVAVGARQSDFEDLEWRMSFSLAEKKLICAMNHTQFLSYGLLKIFLKEVIDMEINIRGLFCSYFFKTSVFWEIAESTIAWNRCTFLLHFMNCICRLLDWLNNSYCPNFFIPENNMFAGKIQGKNREILLNHLYKIYREGYRCLLKCPSLHSALTSLILEPDILNRQPIVEECSNSMVALCIIADCNNLNPDCEVLFHPLLRIETLEYLLSKRPGDLEKIVFQTWLARCLTIECTSIIQFAESRQGNKTNYTSISNVLSLVHRCRSDSVIHYVYQAIILYNIGNYRKVKQILERTKDKLERPCSTYWWEMFRDNYEAAGGEDQPILSVARNILCGQVNLQLEGILEMRELYIETRNLHVLPISSCINLFAPPKVIILFLRYLCLCKLKRSTEKEHTLHELLIIINNDNGHHIPEIFRPISWQLLGVCQQMEGDYWGACQSYLMALRQDWNPFLKKASCIRLCAILATNMYRVPMST